MKYSQEVIDFIKSNVVGTKTRDLIDLVNKKYDFNPRPCVRGDHLVLQSQKFMDISIHAPA